MKSKIHLSIEPSIRDKEMLSITLSVAEWRLIAHFLDELTERFGNDGCNDFVLPGTTFWADLDKRARPEWYEEMSKCRTQLELELEGETEPVFTMNACLSSYVLKRIEERLNR